MGKTSGAKKRERRKDFQKIKFKVGKKLQKNTNETRANFKAKTLIIKQQFQEDVAKEGPVTKRNLSWKELLAHLSHYTMAIKLDALNSIKEICATDSNFIKTEIGGLLENLCPLFVDRDYKVREESMQLFKTILNMSNIKTNKQIFTPFYELINVHLCCAMTHVVEKIQYSSLKILDLLIETIPELIVKKPFNIFENFIDQISKETSSSRGNKRRTLKNDPCKLTSTQAWRYGVLNRLHTMLNVVLSDRIKSNEKLTSKNAENFLELNMDDSSKCLVEFTIKQNKIVNVYDSKEFFDSYSKTIGPLLLDCWIEARPENKNIIESAESINIMHIVLSIFNLLIDKLNYNIFELNKDFKYKNSQNDIENLLLANFPYASEEFDESDLKKSSPSNPINAHNINLQISKMFGHFITKVDETSLFKIFEYALNTIKSNGNGNGEITKKLSSFELDIILELCETILKNFSNSDLIKPFLSSLFNLFAGYQNMSTSKFRIFEFLFNYFYQNNIANSNEKAFLTFYKKSLKYMIACSKEKNTNLESIIDLIRNLTIKYEKTRPILQDDYINLLNTIDSEYKENDIIKKKLLELLYWIPRINRYLLAKLSILIINKKVGSFNANQILEILKLKIENESQVCEQDDYLMFLMNLTNGYTNFDLINPQNCENEYLIVDVAKFQNQSVILKSLIKYIYGHKNGLAIVELLISCILPILNQSSSNYLSTIYGSLKLISSSHELFNFNDASKLIEKILFPIVDKLSFSQNYQNQIDLNDSHVSCLQQVLKELIVIFDKNLMLLLQVLINISNTNSAKTIDDLREKVLVINFLLNKYSMTLIESKNEVLRTNLERLFYYNQDLDGAKYVWWNDFKSLLQVIF